MLIIEPCPRRIGPEPPSEIVDSTLEIDRARRREKENRLRDFPSQTNMIILFIKTRIVIADVSGMNRVHIKEKAEHTCPKTSRFGLKQVFFNNTTMQCILLKWNLFQVSECGSS